MQHEPAGSFKVLSEVWTSFDCNARSRRVCAIARLGARTTAAVGTTKIWGCRVVAGFVFAWGHIVGCNRQ